MKQCCTKTISNNAVLPRNGGKTNKNKDLQLIFEISLLTIELSITFKITIRNNTGTQKKNKKVTILLFTSVRIAPKNKHPLQQITNKRALVVTRVHCGSI